MPVKAYCINFVTKWELILRVTSVNQRTLYLVYLYHCIQMWLLVSSLMLFMQIERRKRERERDGGEEREERKEREREKSEKERCMFVYI